MPIIQLSGPNSETETITLSFRLLYKKALYKCCHWLCDTVHIAVLSRDKQHSASHAAQQPGQSHTPLRTTLESAGTIERMIEKGIFSRQGEGKIGREGEHGPR